MTPRPPSTRSARRRLVLKIRIADKASLDGLMDEAAYSLPEDAGRGKAPGPGTAQARRDAPVAPPDCIQSPDRLPSPPARAGEGRERSKGLKSHALPRPRPKTEDMLAKIGVASIDDLFSDIPKDKQLADRSTCRAAGANSRSSAILRHGGPQCPPRAFRSSSAPALQASRSGDRRPSDPALGIPDELRPTSRRSRRARCNICSSSRRRSRA